MAHIRSQEGTAETGIAAGLFNRQAVFWGLALLFFTAFLLNDFRGFGALGDLSVLDADDGLRLQEVRDLVAGQSWFDTRQYRYHPPEGTLMHWSRLVDAPLAATITLLSPIVGTALAEQIAITGWPLLLFSIYLGLAIWGLVRTFNGRAAALAVVVAANLLAFRDLFGAGAIDHHNAEIVLLLASVLGFAFAGRNPLSAAGSGLASALALAVGLESLTFVAGIGVLYVLAWVFDPRQSRALNVFAVTFALGSLAAFAAQTSPTLWSAPVCDVLSTPWLFLAVAAWGIAAGMTSLQRLTPTPSARLIAATVGGALLVGGFAALFPVCLMGPYHAVPEALRPAWLELTGESFSLPEMLVRYPDKAAVVFGPTLAAVIAAWLGVTQTTGAAKRLLLATAALLTLALALSLFQIRAIYLGIALTPIAAGWALDRILSTVTSLAARVPSSIALVVAASLFFEIPWLSSAALAEWLGVRTAAVAHDPEKMRACLRGVPALAKLPKGVILGPIDLGAHILFLTDQSIVAAGYHRNVEGIVAGLTAFSGSESDLRDIGMRNGADYVALCLPWIDAYPERYSDFSRALVRDAASVSWLEPLPLESDTLRVWRIRPVAPRTTPKPQG